MKNNNDNNDDNSNNINNYNSLSWVLKPLVWLFDNIILSPKMAAWQNHFSVFLRVKMKF